MIKKPKLLDNPDYTPLKSVCQSYIDNLVYGGEDEEMVNYIFEAAVEALYGKEVWNYISKMNYISLIP